MRAKTSRSEFVAANLAFVWERGYHATGVSDYASKVGLPKGSFYNYFDSKVDFALQVVDAYTAAWESLLQRFLTDQTLSVPERFDRFLEQQIHDHCDTHHCVRGCLAGNLGIETANTVAPVAERIEATFAHIEQLFKTAFVQAQNDGLLAPGVSPDTAAALLLNSLEGAFLRMKVARSRTPLQEIRTTLLPLLFGGHSVAPDAQRTTTRDS